MAKKPALPEFLRTNASLSNAHRPDVQPIGPALAELLNPAINRGDAGLGSGTGLQPPPDNSRDRRSGGEAAAHRARASTRGKDDATAKRDASVSPPYASEASDRERERQVSPLKGEVKQKGFDEAPQAEFATPNYGTSATIPTLDPEL